MYLIPGIEHDVGAPKIASDCVCVRVEQTLLLLGDSVTTPVDLDKLGELALQSR